MKLTHDILIKLHAISIKFRSCRLTYSKAIKSEANKPIKIRKTPSKFMCTLGFSAPQSAIQNIVQLRKRPQNDLNQIESGKNCAIQICVYGFVIYLLYSDRHHDRFRYKLKTY